MRFESRDDYETLKRKIIQEIQDTLDLEKVKIFFKSDINSKRALSRIKSLNDIFHLLQERDVLHHQKVTALLYLGQLLKNQPIINLVKVYEKQLDGNTEPCLCGIDDLYIPSVLATLTDTVQEEDVSQSPLQVAIKNIADNIGAKWRILASELDIPECYIDEIRDKYPRDFPKQALKALEIWQKYRCAGATLETLKTALESRLCKMRGIGLHMLNPIIKVE